MNYGVLTIVFALSPLAQSLIEPFVSLQAWEARSFSSIDAQSSYSVERDVAGRSVLRASSNDSASFLLSRVTLETARAPMLRWRWRVDNVHSCSDMQKKAHDDYPIRLSILFEYSSKNASFAKRLSYSTYKTLHGEYPPDSALTYVWANAAQEQSMVRSPYSDDTMLIPVDAGTEKLGTWQFHERDIVADYQQAFGKKPPKRMKVAIMSDADNCHEQATSYLDFVEITVRESSDPDAPASGKTPAGK